MNIASAAHAAAPSLPAMPAVPSTAESSRGAVVPFATQLFGLTEVKGETAAIATATPFLLPKPVVRPVVMSVPLSTTSKRLALDSKHLQKASTDATDAVPVPVNPPVLAPAPEIQATIATAIDNVAAAAKQAAPQFAPEEPVEQTPPSVTAATAPPHQQEMAFAARVKPVQSAEHSALPAEMASNATLASASKKIVGVAEDEHSSQPQALLATPTHTVSHAAEPTATPALAPHAAIANHRSETPNSVTETTPKSATPLKDISLQVNQPGKERVDVRVVQQGSELHVSVHSGDASLTSGLRQGLSELQSKLEETGFRAEMWRPGASSAPVAASPSAQESANHSRGGDGGQPQQHSGSQQESGRRHHQQSNQPRWVEELDSSFGRERASGGFHGFTS